MSGHEEDAGRCLVLELFNTWEGTGSKHDLGNLNRSFCHGNLDPGTN